ncbi:cuticle protein 7-like [Pollicipes pollicipes]|uniref:cuticle protein 7-like n=1 Tax=Pollicipes pollicipes TaxID=41117 RepID=UPI001885121B|nr:cuticle protein 7-like [Pollicipes pollicipes]
MKFLLIAAIAVVAAAAPQHGKGYGHQEDYHEKRPYAYDYAVHDPHYGAQFSKTEHSNGDNVEGQYSVVLPDGRTQHVKYYADHYGGYNADVTYEGYAQYPQYHAPAYHAQPAHKSAYRPVHKATYAAAPVHHRSAYKPVYSPAPAYHKPAYRPVY